MIEAAIIHGHSQPWMYDVLALTMEISGRPKNEIERVLFSSIDFTGATYESLIYSAAYLMRFDRHDSALKLYRQASELQPARPEPYVLSLNQMKHIKELDNIEWVVTGVLSQVWTSGYEARHRRARAIAIETEKKLRDQDKIKQADRFAKLVRQAQQRDLVVKISWSGDGDIDLIVEEPWGSVCSAESTYSAGGGAFLHEGYGPRVENSYESYVCSRGAPGTYRIHIRHILGEIVGKRVRLNIMRYQGTADEFSQSLIVPVTDQDQVIHVALPNGRRNRLRAVPDKNESQAMSNRRERSPILQLLARNHSRTHRAGRSFQESRNVINQSVAGGGPAGGLTVGFTPVVTVLSEGITMSAMALVSGDRRYVRLSIAPSFNTITDVFTFSFVNFGGGGGGGAGNTIGGQTGNGM